MLCAAVRRSGVSAAWKGPATGRRADRCASVLPYLSVLFCPLLPAQHRRGEAGGDESAAAPRATEKEGNESRDGCGKDDGFRNSFLDLRREDDKGDPTREMGSSVMVSPTISGI